MTIRKTTPEELALVIRMSPTHCIRDIVKATGLSKQMVRKIQVNPEHGIKNPRRVKNDPAVLEQINLSLPTHQLIRITGMSKQLVNYYKKRDKVVEPPSIEYFNMDKEGKYYDF